MKKFITIIGILAFNISLLYAQAEKLHTVRVRGQYTVLSTSSALEWKEAPQLARENAKINAIEKVCGAKITAWEQVEMSSAGETYSSLTQIQHDGEIVEFNVIDEGTFRSKVRDIETIFYCEAKVTVKRGVKCDPNFVVSVNGVRQLYYEGDGIEFDVKPSQDCYLKVFLYVNEEVGYLIYPNNLETPFLLKANEVVSFPTLSYWEYQVIKDTEAPYETNRLVFVFTKEELPFGVVPKSRAEIEKWIALIPNDKKCLYSSAFDIRK